MSSGDVQYSTVGYEHWPAGARLSLTTFMDLRLSFAKNTGHVIKIRVPDWAEKPPVT